MVNEKYIEKVMKRAGWSREKAIDALEKAAGSGISGEEFSKRAIWNRFANLRKPNKNHEKDYEIAFRNYLCGEHWKLSDKNREIFCENRNPIDNKNITIRELCAGMGISVPAEYENVADEPQTLAFRSKKVQPGDICVIIRSAEEFGTKALSSKSQYRIAIECGAKMIVMGRKEFKKAGLKEGDFPVILVDDINERVLRFFSILRNQLDAKVVMLTGSVGKTTTKDMCHCVTKNLFRTYANAKNSNTTHQVAKHMAAKAGEDMDVFIHEAGAGYKGSVRLSSEILQPDIFILTNVYKHHLQVYKTLEEIFRDKTSADDYMPKDGVIITNYDDELIRNHTFRHTVKSFAIENEDADFRAVNIRQVQDDLTFDIYEKATGESTTVKIKILGEHNIYNAMAAFILGRTLGLSSEAATAELAHFRPAGIRQNFSNVGGVYVNVDCYNVAEESIVSMLKAGEKIQLEEGGKKIALIGGENKLGKEVRQRSREFGKTIADIKMDRYLFCGNEDQSNSALNHYGDAAGIREAFMNVSDVPSEMAWNVDDMEEFLKANVKPKDLVMIKGIYYLDMPIAVDKAFGTSYSFDLTHYKEAMSKVKADGYEANLIEEFGELELKAAPVADDGTMVIPEQIEGYPVFRAAKNLTKRRAAVKEIGFGASLQNIGEKAFYKYRNLKEVSIPGNVKVIEAKAFAECEKLETVILGKGVTHIGEAAFGSCTALKEVHIPSTVGFIEYNVFDGCEDVIIVCEEGSYAHNYAEENKIKFNLQ